ncbi:MAG TPA: FlgD immunoglobulin-like domain containing protein [Candidatus Eisenbacteria bacterium]|jgi:hypothetical protein
MTRHLRILIALSAFALAQPAWAQEPTARICPHCMDDAVSDTASSPGYEATARRLVFPGYHRKLAFVGIDHHVRYAEWGPTGWAIEVVDAGTRAGGLSMDFDDAGRPIVCYHDSTGGIVFGKRLAAGWALQTIFPAIGVLGTTSLVHASGISAIACVSTGANGLLYLQQVNDNAWTLEMVTSVPPGSGDPSLLIENGTRAIAWHDGSPGFLRLASSSAGNQSWQIELVDGTPGAGRWASLIGHPGDYGVAYSDTPDHQLRYAHPAAGGWAVDVVDGLGARVAGPACGAVELGNSASGLVGIAYYDQGAGDLDYAAGGAPAWPHTWLDQQGDVAATLACGIGPFGAADTVSIVYTERPSGDLFYYERPGAVAGVAGGASHGAMHLTWRRDPAHAGGMLRFEMPARGAARVTILDAQGRRIAEPLTGDLAAGPVQVAWDGRDASGQSVAAGVYFARVCVPGAAVGVRGVVLH